jgi:hypothetical protein
LDGIGVEELFTTTLRSTWILPDAQVEQAQRRLHHAFFATPE